MTESVQVNGHQIEVFTRIWTGKETIKYDGNIVSDRRNIMTFHLFILLKFKNWGRKLFMKFRYREVGENVVMPSVEMGLLRLTSLNI